MSDRVFRRIPAASSFRCYTASSKEAPVNKNQLIIRLADLERENERYKTALERIKERHSIDRIAFPDRNLRDAPTHRDAQEALND